MIEKIIIYFINIKYSRKQQDAVVLAENNKKVSFIGLLKMMLKYVLAFILKIISIIGYVVNLIKRIIRAIIHRFGKTRLGRKIKSCKYIYISLINKMADTQVLGFRNIKVGSLNNVPIECINDKTIVLDKTTDYVYVPTEMGRSPKKESVDIPELYVASLCDAEIVGLSNIVVVKDNLINDLSDYSDNDRIDLRYGDLVATYKDNAIIARRKIARTIDKGIYLVQAGNYNYYHFMIETLSRLVLADEIEKYRTYPILVDAVVRDNKNFYDILEKCNIYNHEVIWIDKDEHYIIKELIYSSSAVLMPGNLKSRDFIKTTDFRVSRWLLQKLRERMAFSYFEHLNCAKKIMISRMNTVNSRLANENAIKDKLKECGYTIIFPEQLNVEKQAQIYSDADEIVATSGASFANILFCKPNTKILCIIPSEHRFYLYSTMAAMLNLDFYAMDAKILEKAAYAGMDLFSGDLSDIDRWIEVTGAPEQLREKI